VPNVARKAKILVPSTGRKSICRQNDISRTGAGGKRVWVRDRRIVPEILELDMRGIFRRI
jgi:hypothetical protein